jgi:hypothetical protein
MISEKELIELFRAALKECTDVGMELPLIACAVSPNGSVNVTRIDKDVCKTCMLAEHIEEPGFRLPLNIMMVDRDGVTARVSIRRHKEIIFLQ